MIIPALYSWPVSVVINILQGSLIKTCILHCHPHICARCVLNLESLMTPLLTWAIISSISTSAAAIIKHLLAFGGNKVGTNFIVVALTNWERRTYLSTVIIWYKYDVQPVWLFIKMENSFSILPSGFNRLLVHLWFSLLSGRLRHLYILKPNTETVSGSSGTLHMSARNGSASDADCRISEDIPVPDVELMELGPLLEEGGGRPEVGFLFRWGSVIRGICHCSASLLFHSFEKGALMLSDEEEEDDEVEEVLTLPLQAHRAMEKMEEFVHKVNPPPPLDKHVGSNKRLSFKTSMNISLHNERATPCWDPLWHAVTDLCG